MKRQHHAFTGTNARRVPPGQKRSSRARRFPAGWPRRGLMRLGPGQPAQRGVLVLGPRRLRGPGGHEEPQVRVLVRRFPFPAGTPTMTRCRSRASGHGARSASPVSSPASRQGDGQRVALARVAVPADLQPGLLPLVPAQQHPGGFRMHDQRGRGDVQRQLAPPRVTDGLARARARRRSAVSASPSGCSRPGARPASTGQYGSPQQAIVPRGHAANRNGQRPVSGG